MHSQHQEKKDKAGIKTQIQHKHNTNTHRQQNWTGKQTTNAGKIIVIQFNSIGFFLTCRLNITIGNCDVKPAQKQNTTQKVNNNNNNNNNNAIFSIRLIKHHIVKGYR